MSLIVKLSGNFSSTIQEQIATAAAALCVGKRCSQQNGGAPFEEVSR